MDTLVYYDLGHSYSSNDFNGISGTMNMFGLTIQDVIDFRWVNSGDIS